MRNGLLVYFGDATRPHAKWLSLARVLADPSSAGASYVDVRLPVAPGRRASPRASRPPSASTAASAGRAARSGSSESAVAALAAGLSSGTRHGVDASGTEAPSSGAGGERRRKRRPAARRAAKQAAEATPERRQRRRRGTGAPQQRTDTGRLSDD